ncbi:serine hydrolase [Streptomyces sp. NPDC055078]
MTHHPPRTAAAVLGAVLLVALVTLVTLLTAAPAVADGGRGAGEDEDEVVCASFDVEMAYGLGRDILDAVEGRAATTAVYLHDQVSGTSCELGADRRFDSASVVKVTVLGALLREAAERGRALTGREARLVRDMITRSDNAATDALWRQLGRAGIEDFLAAAGMADTVPGEGGRWGLTQITARDEQRLLALLTTANSVLTDASRAYVLKLMREVVPAQRWGTTAGASATAQVKNGWLPRAAHGWRVHSIGAFTGGGRNHTITVLTQDNATMGSGVDTVEAVSRAVHPYF